MKIKLITTDVTLPHWTTLATKKREILKALNAGKNANFTDFDIELQPDLVPEINSNQRIVHRWLDTISLPRFKQGYNFVGLHFSMAGWLKAGLASNLNGANPIDGNMIGEFYLRSDEHTIRNNTGLLQFIQTILHEICHEYFRGSGLPDITHEYHNKHRDIRGLVATLDWSLYRPELKKYRATESALINMLLKVVAGLQAEVVRLLALTPTPVPMTLINPVPMPYVAQVTQPYGVRNARYPLTGHHIGTDYPTPTGTKLVAPWAGRTTEVGYSTALGYFLHYQFTYLGKLYTMRLAHLNSMPLRGERTRGAHIAFSGNTGQSTGAHTHVDVWNGAVNLQGINASNFRTRTVDPHTLFSNL